MRPLSRVLSWMDTDHRQKNSSLRCVRGGYIIAVISGVPLNGMIFYNISLQPKRASPRETGTLLSKVLPDNEKSYSLFNARYSSFVLNEGLN